MEEKKPRKIVCLRSCCHHWRWILLPISRLLI